MDTAYRYQKSGAKRGEKATRMRRWCGVVVCTVGVVGVVVGYIRPATTYYMRLRRLLCPDLFTQPADGVDRGAQPLEGAVGRLRTLENPPEGAIEGERQFSGAGYY